MEKNPNIDQAFQKAFEQFEVKPSDQVWDGIENDLLDQTFSDAFNSFEAIPAAGLFAGISEQLVPDPINEAQFDETFKEAFAEHEVTPDVSNWESIQRLLPLSLILKRFLTTSSFVAVLLVFIGIVAYWQDDATNNSPSDGTQAPNTEEQASLLPSFEDQITTSNQTAESLELIPENSGSTDSEIKISSNNSEGLAEQSIPNSSNLIPDQSSILEDLNPIVGSASPDDSNERSKTILIQEEDQLAALAENKIRKSYQAIQIPSANVHLPVKEKEKTDPENWTEGLPQLFQGPYSQERLLHIRDKAAQKESLLFKGAYFSVNSQFLASWTRNQSIKSRIANGNTLSSSPYLSATYGAGIGLQIKPRFALELNWANARVGQRYSNTDTNEKSELRGTYNYFPVTVRYTTLRFPGTQKVPITMNLIGGIHYGRLESAVLMTGVEGISFEDKVIQNELGLHAGMDYLFHFDPNLFVSFGPRIYVGTEAERLIGLGSSTTTNVQAGFNLGVHYRIKPH